MKSTLNTLFAALQRPTSPQALLRLFAAGAGPHVPHVLRYLAVPHYRTIGGKTVTFAGDGRVFLWTTGQRVPGFSDYQHPPAGMGYVDVPSVLALKRNGGQTQPCPMPAGSWTGAACDDVYFMQHPARIRRFDLMRLSLLDSVTLQNGEQVKHASGLTHYWRTVGITWKWGSLSGSGVILCQPVRAAGRKHTRRKPGN